MDVGHSKFETAMKSITLLYNLFTKGFIPNMIMDATQANVELLDVDGTRGEFETGCCESRGQTREHALSLRSLGMSSFFTLLYFIKEVQSITFLILKDSNDHF